MQSTLATVGRAGESDLPVLATHAGVCERDGDAAFLELVVVRSESSAGVVLAREQDHERQAFWQRGYFAAHLVLEFNEGKALGSIVVVQHQAYVLDDAILHTIQRVSKTHTSSPQGVAYRLEQGLEILFGDKPTETSNIYLAVVRIAVCAFLPPLRI